MSDSRLSPIEKEEEKWLDVFDLIVPRRIESHPLLKWSLEEVWCDVIWLTIFYHHRGLHCCFIPKQNGTQKDTTFIYLLPKSLK